MINKICVSGYKCLKNTPLNVDNLNIFVGANASGKSSFLQTLLLLRQSSQGQSIDNLKLSGPLYEGGLATDVLHPDSKHTIDISINSSKIRFKHNRDKEDATQARVFDRDTPSDDLTLENQNLTPLLGDQFIYLNAERASPKVTYGLPPTEKILAGKLGKHGEYTAALLADAESNVYIAPDWTEVATKLIEAAKDLEGLDLEQELKDSGGRLDLMTNSALKWVIPGACFLVQKQNDTDSSTLKFIRDTEKTRTAVRATHIGFGLTYTLPIITGALMLAKDSIMIVENPEAHLHPFSQSRIGVFLAIMASFGKQIFIETHSDHVVNGIRLAIAKGYLPHTQLKTHFFNKPIDGTTARVTSINCDEDGYMDQWPDGFFDQIESDLSKL
ncbi:DUF3696 domain-containing protein [Agaribacterium sp. ZY112]|uniref:DUF3696 domain-containing protein n=1 Tax=Agaribacterium sp. ZY112 TaxID=3233574 RepID=UPI0035243C19